MLRILLWKLGIEWAHLWRVLRPGWDQRIYYFAFGANLSEAVLATRRIRVFDVFDYALEGAALRFSQPGFYRDHGYASADAQAGSVVYGKMYQILETDARRMDYFEGVPFLGAHEKVYGQVDGKPFFYYRTTQIVGGLKPTREYLDYIVDAYRQMPSVPAEVVGDLQQREVLQELLPVEVTGFFVRDAARWPRWLGGLLVAYERLCLRTMAILWHRSPLQSLIRA